jgi:ATP-binding cassette subfamily F protein 3
VTLVSLEKVDRHFGDLAVLEGVSLRIEERDRVGIVGDNGSGKTTLVRVLAGVDEPDRGTRNARRKLRVAYGEQAPEIQSGDTVWAFVLRGNGEFRALEEQVHALAHRLEQAPDDPHLLAEYGQLQGAFEAGGGYDREHLCERVLSGLGFAEADQDKDVAVLSGGERTRLALATLMTQPAELLVLDEPTNHLDLGGIAFLEDYIQRYPGAVVAVSHDRRFLDNVSKTILEVEACRVVRFKGNFAAYQTQRDQALLAQSRSYKTQQEFYEKEMEYIRRHMAGRWHAQAKGRLKRLKRLQLISRPKTRKSEMKLRFAGGRGLKGQSMVEVEELQAVLPGGQQLFAEVSFRLYHGETVGVLGRNGAGKTTLLRMLAGHLAPAGGTIKRAQRTKVGYFSQEVSDLPHHGSVFDVLKQLAPAALDKELRDHLALFLFTGDEVDQAVKSLSGGEKQRLALACLTFTDYDYLCLDEPTNHLDITGREGLEEALAEYPGGALVISHDRQFLESVTDRVVYLADGRLRVFDGGLDQCLKALAAERQRKGKKPTAKQAPKQPASQTTRAPTTAPGKVRNPLMFQKLEEEIFALEERVGTLRENMATPDSYNDHNKMRQLQAEERALLEELQAAYKRWENWS